MTKRTIQVVIADSLEELTPKELGFLVSQGDTLSKVFTAAKAYATAQVQSGAKVPGWTMGKGKRSREWKSPEDAIAAMASVGINDPYDRPEPTEPPLFSPSKAEGKIKGDDEKIAMLAVGWEWIDGKPALVPAPLSADDDLTPDHIRSTPNYGF